MGSSLAGLTGLGFDECGFDDRTFAIDLGGWLFDFHFQSRGSGLVALECRIGQLLRPLGPAAQVDVDGL